MNHQLIWGISFKMIIDLKTLKDLKTFILNFEKKQKKKKKKKGKKHIYKTALPASVYYWTTCRLNKNIPQYVLVNTSPKTTVCSQNTHT